MALLRNTAVPTAADRTKFFFSLMRATSFLWSFLSGCNQARPSLLSTGLPSLVLSVLHAGRDDRPPPFRVHQLPSNFHFIIEKAVGRGQNSVLLWFRRTLWGLVLNRKSLEIRVSQFSYIFYFWDSNLLSWVFSKWRVTSFYSFVLKILLFSRLNVQKSDKTTHDVTHSLFPRKRLSF